MAGFFEKVSAGIDKGVASVSEGSKNIVGKAKLNSQIQDIQKNKMNIFTNLGELVYNLTVSGAISVEQCAGMCNEITSYNEKIEELQKEIVEIEMKKNAPAYITEVPAAEDAICPNCGMANPSGSKFCAGCGTAIPEKSEVPEVEESNSIYTSGPTSDAVGIVCPNCETLNTPESKFCAGCGMNMAEVEEAPSMTVCPGCSATNEPEARFCASCGTPLK